MSNFEEGGRGREVGGVDDVQSYLTVYNEPPQYNLCACAYLSFISSARVGEKMRYGNPLRSAMVLFLSRH